MYQLGTMDTYIDIKYTQIIYTSLTHMHMYIHTYIYAYIYVSYMHTYMHTASFMVPFYG